MVNPKTWSPERTDLDLTDGTRALLVEFRRHLKSRGLAVGSIRMYVDHVASLSAACGDLREITLEDLEERLARKHRTTAPETRKSMRSAWRQFYKWMVRVGYLDEDPTELLDPVRVPQRAGRIVSDEKVIAALELATLPEKAMILLGRYAALRLNEITTLSTYDREGDVLSILGKGGKRRLVPINDELLEVLIRLEHIQGEGYYFPGRWGGHMHRESVYKIIVTRLGSNPHSLRHAAATAAYKGTGDLRAVQELLGHASLATTQRYLHVDPATIRAAAAATTIHSYNARKPSAIERGAYDSDKVSA